MNYCKNHSFHNSYSTYGIGNKAYFTFHGFGQTPRIYRRLADKLPNSTIYSFCLFGHEDNSESIIYPNKAKWISEFQSLIDSLEIDNVTLIAHSIGARHATAIIGYLPKRVKKVYLIAPDGFENFNIFDFCTRTKIGKSAFTNFLKYYEHLIPLFNLAKIFPPTKELLLFAQSQINKKNKRDILHKTWNAYGKFGANQKLITQNITDFKIDVELVLAKKDPIINNRNLLKLFRKIKSIKIKQLEYSHYQILTKWIDEIAIKK